jgi:preprotein translocase subunit SecA
MGAESVTEIVADMREDVIAGLVSLRIPERAFAEQWETAALAADIKRVLALDLPIEAWAAEEGMDETGLRERIAEAATAAMGEKFGRFGPELANYIEKSVLLQTLDQVWKEHLLALDYLRQGIGLRAYGQRDPLNEYKREAFLLFNGLTEELKERVTNVLSHVTINEAPAAAAPPPPVMTPLHAAPGALPADVALAEPVARGAAIAELDPARPESWSATPRNAACPCGSGRKYKYCHGRV